MEESEKRRERLKAMRMEAAQSDANNDVENSTQTRGLSNPLLETTASNQDSCPQRFGYYTDPLAAFSGNKRSKVNQNIAQEHLTPPIQEKTAMTPPPLPSQSMHQQQESVWSPMGMVCPSGMQPGTPRGAWNGPGPAYGYNTPPSSTIGGNFPNTAGSVFAQGRGPIINSNQGQGQWLPNGPSPNSEQGVRPGFWGHQGRPTFNPIEGRGYWSTNSQSPGSVHEGDPGFGKGGRGSYESGHGRGYWSSNSLNPSPGRGSSPGFGQGGRPKFNSGQGRGSWSRNSHNPGSGYRPNLGRGSGQWSDNNANPGTARSGGRGGRGRGFHDNVSAEFRPDLYYNKSMVEDPWKFLTPIIWTREECTSSQSWLPKSISTQRAKAPGGSSESNKSQPSLAEYLAASFNDATKNDESII